MESKVKFSKLFDKDHVGYFFILPSLLIIFIFTIVPLFEAFGIAATDMNIFMSKWNFTGMENFVRSFQDERLLNSFKNTAVFVLFNVPVQIAISLVLAFWLYQSTWFGKFCRSVYYIPVLCSSTAVGIIFNLMLNSTVGYIPYIISKFTGEPIALLAEEKYAMAVIIFLAIWKSFGKTVIILVSGINNISSTYFEASEIDGASKMQQFFYITIPNLLPTLNFILLTSIIGAFQVFDIVYVTTGGGPNFSTETIVQYIYNRGFSAPYEVGYASAMAVELFIIIAVIILFFKGFMERKIEKTF